MNDGMNWQDTGVERGLASNSVTSHSSAAWLDAGRRLATPTAASAAARLVVRCTTGELRVIAVWAALGGYARNVTRSEVQRERKLAADVLNLTFRDMPEVALAGIAAQLATLPWVRDARVQR